MFKAPKTTDADKIKNGCAQRFPQQNRHSSADD